MPVLTDAQMKNGYFHRIGGFPPLNETDDRTNYAQEVKDYRGQERSLLSPLLPKNIPLPIGASNACEYNAGMPKTFYPQKASR